MSVFDRSSSRDRLICPFPSILTMLQAISCSSVGSHATFVVCESLGSRKFTASTSNDLAKIQSTTTAGLFSADADRFNACVVHP